MLTAKTEDICLLPTAYCLLLSSCLRGEKQLNYYGRSGG